MLSNASSVFSQSQPFLRRAFVATSWVKPISISLFTLALLTSGEAYLATHYLAWSLNFLRFYLYYPATTASCGSFGSGTQSKACKESKAVLMVRAGDHQSFRISRQIAPVAEEILGCQIFVQNFIFGGLQGYSCGIWISIWKIPPWQGVSSGPSIDPTQCRMLLSRRLTLTVEFSLQIFLCVQPLQTLHTLYEFQANSLTFDKLTKQNVIIKFII